MNENDNPVLKWLQSQPLPINTVPGTNVNSNRTVGTQQVQRKVQVKDETPKTLQDGLLEEILNGILEVIQKLMLFLDPNRLNYQQAIMEPLVICLHIQEKKEGK